MIKPVQVTNGRVFRSLIFLLFLSLFITGCGASGQIACPVTEPIWAKPPVDSAVEGTPVDGFYYVNSDQSIWASAWWQEQEENYLRASEEGIKMGWFRPAGSVLAIAGQRIDAEAVPLGVDIPCCYPTSLSIHRIIFSFRWMLGSHCNG